MQCFHVVKSQSGIVDVGPPTRTFSDLKPNPVGNLSKMCQENVCAHSFSRGSVYFLT